jgi:hypothetical protein
VIVEFAGLPGSGKSTAAGRLQEAASARGIEVRTALDLRRDRSDPSARVQGLLPRMASQALAIASHPWAVWAAVAALGRSQRSPAEKWYALRHVFVTFKVLRAARRGNGSDALIVLPEGLCQRGFLTFVDGGGVGSRAGLRRFLADAPQPDVVILLRTPPGVALSRVARRGHGAISYRFDGLSRRALHDRMIEGQQLLTDAAGFLASRRGVRMIVLDGGDLTSCLLELEGVVLPGLLRELEHHHDAPPDAKPS